MELSGLDGAAVGVSEELVAGDAGVVDEDVDGERTTGGEMLFGRGNYLGRSFGGVREVGLDGLAFY